MTTVPRFAPDRFKSTVPYYVAHRLRYPSALVDEAVRRVGLGCGDRVLDLGCGPGTLTIELMRFDAGEVVGMDPDPAMLAAARTEAAAAQVSPRFVEGSSYDLSAETGPYRLVTMGRSFHWMDRAATLRTLDGMIEPDGAIIIFTELPEQVLENQWKRVVTEVQRQFLDLRGDGGSRHHAAILLSSPFSKLELYAVIERLPITIDGIVGRALSELDSAPEALGDRMGEFETRLRRRLRGLSPSGEFTEVIQFGALICRRRHRRQA